MHVPSGPWIHMSDAAMCGDCDGFFLAKEGRCPKDGCESWVNVGRLLDREVIEQKQDCWLWKGSLNENGYGGLRLSGPEHRGVKTHRIVYRVLRGPIPTGMDLDHLCRNRSCVNPEHLEPVSRAENLRRGNNSKLSDKQVGEIRAARFMGEPLSTIARRFGVGAPYLSRLTRGQKRRAEDGGEAAQLREKLSWLAAVLHQIAYGSHSKEFKSRLASKALVYLKTETPVAQTTDVSRKEVQSK